MIKIIRDCFTGKDNETYDIVRIVYFISCSVYFLLSILETFHGHDFKPVEFGTGLGLITTAAGGALALKHRTEPDGDDDVKPTKRKTKRKS